MLHYLKLNYSIFTNLMLHYVMLHYFNASLFDAAFSEFALYIITLSNVAVC